ncbi:Membrane spanning protein [Streptococcus pneumoniae]|nr:Membrane spanning protein [Streptococcus pneumoniae]
MTLTTFLYKQ